METSILGIIGILLTLTFGIYSIWSYIKTNKPVRLEFQNKGCNSLFRDDVKRLNIDITYNKKSLSNNLILLKAKLLNNGKLDIDKARIHSPLKIIASENYDWLETNIKYQPESAVTNIKILNTKEIQIDWDLLKKNEFINIEALCEFTDFNKTEDENLVTNFYNNLKFDYRITDLDNIQKNNQDSSSIFYKKFIKTLFGYMFLMTGIMFSANHFYPLLFNEDIRFNIDYVISNGNDSFIGNLKPKKNQKIELFNKDSKKLNKIPIAEFNSDYKIEKVNEVFTYKYAHIKGLFVSTLYIIVGTLLIISSKRKRKKKNNR